MSKSSPTASSPASNPWSVVDSNHETTPRTDLTQLSPCTPVDVANWPLTPDDAQVPPFTLKQLLPPDKNAPRLGHLACNGGTSDPFCGKSSGPFQAATAGLSPTAASFTPVAASFSSSGSEIEGAYTESRVRGVSRAPNANEITIRSIADEIGDLGPSRGPSLLSLTGQVRRHVPQLPCFQKPNPCHQRDSRAEGRSFSHHEDEVSRFLKISNISPWTDIRYLDTIFTDVSFNVPQLVVLSDLPTHGVVYAYFSDIRDASAALTKISATHDEWVLAFTKQDIFGATLNYKHRHDFESVVLVTATCLGSSHTFQPNTVLAMIFNFLSSFGDFHGWTIVETNSSVLAVQVEYFDCEISHRVRELSGFKLAGISLQMQHRIAEESEDPGMAVTTAMKVGQDIHSLRKPRTVSNEPRRCWSDTWAAGIAPESLRTVQERWIGSTEAFGLSHPAHHMDLAPRSQDLRLQQYNSSAYNCASLASPRRFGPKFEHRSGENMSIHHNVVDIGRISSGIDVRTTIMLRNIPNKITQAMLKDIIDETSRGKYDFMYLRIDFANNCNVGYAFINFEDPWHIVDFVKARAGRRWNCFSSDKIAEVSYATIQGKDCLVQKFRNSSVMMEHPSFRPKIFCTGEGLEAGQEVDFPGPDNTMKMRRSVENAEHVGLFAPRSGQQFRDDQKRRRSQFDRGTRQAQLEFFAGAHPERLPLPPPFAF